LLVLYVSSVPFRGRAALPNPAAHHTMLSPLQWQAGLDMMRKLGTELSLEIDVHGPTESMTGICKLAIDWVQLDA
jgi:ATP citrate lyase citrate-binding